MKKALKKVNAWNKACAAFNTLPAGKRATVNANRRRAGQKLFPVNGPQFKPGHVFKHVPLTWQHFGN